MMVAFPSLRNRVVTGTGNMGSTLRRSRHAGKRSSLLAVATLVIALAQGCASTPGADSTGRFEIGLIGDQHYDAESTAMFPNLMASLNRADLAFRDRLMYPVDGGGEIDEHTRNHESGYAELVVP